MKSYSVEFRGKIVKTYQAGDTSVRRVAERFHVACSFVQKLLKQQAEQGHLQPAQQGRPPKTMLDGYETQLQAMVEKYPDATLSEYCEYWGETYGQWLSRATLCRALNKVKLTRKKRPYAARKQPQNEFKSSGASTGSR